MRCSLRNRVIASLLLEVVGCMCLGFFEICKGPLGSIPVRDLFTAVIIAEKRLWALLRFFNFLSHSHIRSVAATKHVQPITVTVKLSYSRGKNYHENIASTANYRYRGCGSVVVITATFTIFPSYRTNTYFHIHYVVLRHFTSSSVAVCSTQ